MKSQTVIFYLFLLVLTACVFLITTVYIFSCKFIKLRFKMYVIPLFFTAFCWSYKIDDV